jgi:C-terminal processing protease CtpA/Prc
LTRASRDAPYGFDAKTIKAAGLPAPKAGLRVADYILKVNGEQVLGIEHDQVFHKLSHHSTHLDLLVILTK